MKHWINIFVIVLITVMISKGSIAAEISEEDAIKGLENSDVQKRIPILMTFNNIADKKNKILSENIRIKIYSLLDDYIANSDKYRSAEIDDEGVYFNELIQMAAKINNQKVLPFLLYSFSHKTSQIAIAAQGDVAINDLIGLLWDKEKAKFGADASVIKIFTLMVKDKKEGYVACGETRKKIKEEVTKFYKQYSQPISAASEKEKYQQEIRVNAEHKKRPVLEFYLALGDADVIPYVEEIAKNDLFYEEWPTGMLKYRRMKPKELVKNSGEAMKVKEDYEKKVKATGVEEKVKYYPVRERAEEVLTALKRKNGLQ